MMCKCVGSRKLYLAAHLCLRSKCPVGNHVAMENSASRSDGGREMTTFTVKSSSARINCYFWAAELYFPGETYGMKLRLLARAQSRVKGEDAVGNSESTCTSRSVELSKALEQFP